MFLQDFDLDKHYEENYLLDSPDRELLRAFQQYMGSLPQSIDRVYWFHLTRTLLEEDFSEGILPLTDSLDKLWDIVFRVFSGTHHLPRLERMKNEGFSNYLYNLKARQSFHAGPYAMLVRESAFLSQEIGNHNYLRMPEILEDICNGYRESFNEEIFQILSNALVPKIVKFWSHSIDDDKYLAPALFYLYAKLYGRSMSIYANKCFDGRNRPILPKQIEFIEHIS